MKRVWSLLLAFLTAFTLASCGVQNSANDTVDVDIPAALLTGDNAASEKLTAEQKKQGITKAVVHEDGSVTYTFRRDAYDAFVSELKQTTAQGLDQIIHDDDVKSIQKVDYNDDFSAMTFYIDKAAFENSMDGLTCYGAYLAVSYYKAYAKEDDRCTITIIDNATGETLGTVVYPDALNADAETQTNG